MRRQGITRYGIVRGSGGRAWCVAAQWKKGKIQGNGTLVFNDIEHEGDKPGHHDSKKELRRIRRGLWHKSEFAPAGQITMKDLVHIVDKVCKQSFPHPPISLNLPTKKNIITQPYLCILHMPTPGGQQGHAREGDGLRGHPRHRSRRAAQRLVLRGECDQEEQPLVTKCAL